MKKLFVRNFFKNILSNVLGGAIICIALSGCENFLGDVNLKQQLAEDIAYAKAKSIAILIQADEGTGTVVPAGNYTAKQGYPFEISFTEAAGYSFNGWKAVPADDAEALPENAVVFDDPNSIKTNVTVNADISNIKIVPGCDDRIAIKEKSPLLGNTVSRNSSIVVVFSKEPDKQSFIFSEDEIPEGAETVKNDDEEIYAYVHEGETKFKNIQITINDISIAQHYLQPQVEGKTLVINANPARLIEFDQAGSSKIVSVTLSDKIFDKDNVSMNKTENWKFTINEETNEKARIELTSNAEEGAVYLAGTRDYSMGQKITLSFTENADYQFLNWQYDNNIVTVDDPYSSDTFAFVKAESNATQIKAVCAPRLRVTEVSPLSTESVSKNTPIEITFNKDLPVDDKGLLQLENISITIGGSPVRTSFKTPEVSNNKITFTADMQNMLDVPAGQTKTVTVTVPSDFYYQLEDENKTKVYYGGNGKTFSYRINETTSQKAFITFSASEGSGTIVKNADSSQGYSIGQEVEISFEPADDTWQFDGWTVDVEESKIEIKDKTAIKTVLRINEAPLTATVKAKVSKKLVAQLSGLSLDSPNPKDSQIKIVFNKELDPACADSKILKKIKISTEGNSLDSYYTDRSLSGNTITIKNTSYISVPNESTKIISVAVPEDFYYTNEGTKVSFKEQTYSFNIDYTTNAKTKVTYKVLNGESPDTGFAASGSIKHSLEDLQTLSYEELNIGEEINLFFALNDGYQFNGWKISGKNSNGENISESDIKISDKDNLSTRLYVYKPLSSVIVEANTCLKPSVVSVQPAEGINNAEVPIKLNFNMAMDASKLVYASDKISITYGVAQMESYFETPVLSENGRELTITPKTIALKDCIKSINAASIDLRVSLKTGITITKDGVSIPLLQNDNSSIIVSYKPEVEKTPPEKLSFFATRKNISLQTAGSLSSSDKFVLKQVDSMTNAEILQNRTKGTVYLYGKYSDIGSGVSTVTVTQRRTNTRSKATPDISELTTKVFTKNSTGVEFKTESSGITTFCIPYDITEDDGAILLTVTVEDAAGNPAVTTEAFSAIKCSVLYMGEYNDADCSCYKLYNKLQGLGSSLDSDKEVSFNLTEYKNGINEFTFSFADSCAAIYGDNFSGTGSVGLDFENLTIQMKYTNKNGQIQTGTFSTDGVPSERLSYERKLVLDVDGYLYGKTMELIITDDMGNVGRKTYSFPSESDFSVYLDSNNRVQVTCPSSYAGTTFYCREFIRTGGNYATTYQPIYRTSVNYNLSIIMNYNKTGYDEGDDYLYLGKTTSLYKSFDSLQNSSYPTVTLPTSESSRYSLSKGEANQINVTLKINSTSWDTCDKIFIYNSDAIIHDKSQNCLYFTKNSTSLTFPVSVDSFHKYDSSFSVYGEKNSLRSSPATISIPKVTANSYDTVIPGIMFRLDNSELTGYGNYTMDSQGAEYKGETFNIYIKDDWSGPKSGTLTLSDGTTYTLNSSNYYTASIPVWKLLNKYDTFYCAYKIQDNNGNVNEGIWAPQIKDYLTCSGTTLNVNSTAIDKSYIYVGQNSGSWTKYSGFAVSNRRTETLPGSKFIKATGFWSYFHSAGSSNGQIYKPKIHYTGSASSGNYDYILPNNESSILVASDAPVFAQTLVTNRPYEECSTWSAEKWECFHKHIGDKYMTFTSSDHSPQKYTIPLSEINSGECYCVVVHFADNTTAMSDVKQK